MNLKDAERWKKLERRARERGWTIDLLAVDSDSARNKGSKGEFALMELGGTERALAIGDLDMIEALLKSSEP